MVRHLLLACLLGAASTSLLLAPQEVQAKEDYEYSTTIAQGKSYFKQGLYREAYRELRKALSTKTGDKSFEAHYLYSQAAFKIFDIPQAIEFSRLAIDLATSPAETASAQDFNTYLTMSFGKVEFIAAEDELKEGYLILEPQEPILDPDVQAFYDEKVRPFYLQKRSLPWVMWLPAIAFQINGNDFLVEPGELIQVEAGFNPDRVAEQEARIAALRAEEEAERRRQAGAFGQREGAPAGLYSQIGVGVFSSSGSALESSDLRPTIDLTVGKEFGRLGVMAFGAVSPGTVETLNPASGVAGEGSSTDPNLGVLATFRVWLPSGLSLLPGVGLSYGMAAGSVYSCDRSNVTQEGEALVYSDCSAGVDTTYVQPYQAYIQARGLGPVGRLGLVYEREMAFGYLGGGLTLHASRLSVAVPEQNEGVSGSGQAIVVEVKDPVRNSLMRVGAVIGVNAAF